MTLPFDPRELILKFAKDNSTVPTLQFIANNPEDFKIQDVGDTGVVNYVFRVSSRDTKQSVIIKYGEETMKNVPTEEVSLDRQVLEYDSLHMLQTMLPGSVPEVYCLDRKNNAIAMQDMSEWELLGTQLKKRNVDLDAATFLGQQLGKINMQTSQDVLTSEKWQEMTHKFSQDKLKEQLVSIFYQRPMVETDGMNVIPKECLETYRSYVTEIEKCGFVEKVTNLFDQKECFIHADCHCFSVFVKDRQTALFDFEYAFLGPAAANIAMPLIAYLEFFLLEEAHSESSTPGKTTPNIEQLRRSFAQGAKFMVEGYLKAHTIISSDKGKTETFLSDSALMTGANMFFMGTSFCLSAVCEALPCERASFMAAGFNILKRHAEVKTVDQLIDVMFDKYE